MKEFFLPHTPSFQELSQSTIIHMNLIVNNKTQINVILSIDGVATMIEANASNTTFRLDDGQHQLRVKRVDYVPLPEYKKMLWADILGGVSRLMMKPSFYVFDVSSEYRIDSRDNDTISIDIVRGEHHLLADDAVYDIVSIDFSGVNPVNSRYTVENKEDICKMYGKCKGTAHFWLYMAIEVLFTLAGMSVMLPILLMIYSATGWALVKAIMIMIPFLLMGIIALIGVLPLHIVYKIQDNAFYRSMDHEQIHSYLANSK